MRASKCSACWPLEALTVADILHFQASTLLFGSQRRRTLAFPRVEPLVALFVFLLEVQISWWAWTLQDCDPVLDQRALRERPVSILFHELVRVQILAGGFTPADQKKMVYAKAERVRPS